MERSTRACEPLILAFSPAAKNAAEAKEFSLALQAQRSRERERVRVTNTWPGKNPGWQKKHPALPGRRMNHCAPALPLILAFSPAAKNAAEEKGPPANRRVD
jgi:hypothetical protein